ncbi:hypothetical protein, partial [Kordiimonas sp.]|uniref:hypothetical protein n=1 Tax=Kordiimonas sp. TaxID=1970157 RepID=UPI003A948CA1
PRHSRAGGTSVGWVGDGEGFFCGQDCPLLDSRFHWNDAAGVGWSFSTLTLIVILGLDPSTHAMVQRD